MVFQIESLCSQMTDDAILLALEDLPQDLSETFNRILRKLYQSNDVELALCKKIFQIISVSKRPLSSEELRGALSVEVGNTEWNERNMINNITQALRCCGSLITVDEEHDTVHFTHHSVKQHLLSKFVSPDLIEFGVNLVEANLIMGDIIVTYLSMKIFGEEVAKATPVPMPVLEQQKINYPLEILKGSLPRSNIVNKAALRWLKSKEYHKHDLLSLSQNTPSETSESATQIRYERSFLVYSQTYWLHHTKDYDKTRDKLYRLWKHLLDSETKPADLPLALESCRRNGRFDFAAGGNFASEWVVQNLHWALMSEFGSYRLFIWNPFVVQLLRELSKDFNDHPKNWATLLNLALNVDNNLALQLLIDKGAGVNAQSRLGENILCTASSMGKEKAVHLLLEKGADVNAQGGYYGNALQAASFKNDNYFVVGLLLESGAKVNAQGGHYGNALQAASYQNNEAAVRLLLERGADVNAQGGYYGNALQAASWAFNDKIVRLLLEKGADVNAQGGLYGNALQAALSAYNNETVVRLLLERGANVNAQGGYYGNALQAALRAYNN